MKEFQVEKIEKLEDVFYALMGGAPKDIKEIKEFLAHNKLNELLYSTDIERILEFDGFFAEETVDAIYSLLPAKIPLSGNRKWIMPPQVFRRLNHDKAMKSNSIIITIPFSMANKVYRQNIDGKMSEVIQIIHDLKQKKEGKRCKNTKSAQDDQLKNLKAELKKIKSRINTKKYRMNHPDAQKSYYVKIEDLSEEQKEARRAENRKHNRKYRAMHRNEIRRKANERRSRLKEENPELLKEKDKEANRKANRKEICKRYYEKHKAEISQKAAQNPKVKIYKARYKAKKKLEKQRQATGQVVGAVSLAEKSR